MKNKNIIGNNKEIEFLLPAIKAFREGGMAKKLERKGSDLGPLFVKFL